MKHTPDQYSSVASTRINSEANGRLIAAAPAMLTALIKIKHLLDNYDGQSLESLAAIADEVIGIAIED